MRGRGWGESSERDGATAKDHSRPLCGRVGNRVGSVTAPMRPEPRGHPTEWMRLQPCEQWDSQVPGRALVGTGTGPRLQPRGQRGRVDEATTAWPVVRCAADDTAPLRDARIT
eukprot:363611-Chlamydomonas_euryale.AAC.20